MRIISFTQSHIYFLLENTKDYILKNALTALVHAVKVNGQSMPFLEYLVYISCWHQCIWSPPKGFFFSRGFGCKHHLQQDPRPGPPTARHLPEPPRCHHRHWGGRSAGHQWVPVSVSLRTVELLCPWREDRLWERAESRSVGAARWAVLLCVRVLLWPWFISMRVWPCETSETTKG